MGPALWNYPKNFGEFFAQTKFGYANYFGMWTCWDPEFTAKAFKDTMDAFSEKAGIPIYCGEHGWSTANPPTYCNYTKQPSQNGWGAGDNFTDYSTEEYAAQYHKAVFEAGMN